MKLAIESKLRSEAYRLFVPVTRFSFANFPIEITRILPRCAGPVALQVTSSRRTGTTPTQRQALLQPQGI